MRVLFHQQPSVPADSDPVVDTHRMTIQEELEQSRFALEIAYSNFDNVTDPDLIDCYIYEVNAVMKRYKYLLSQAAAMELVPASKRRETL